MKARTVLFDELGGPEVLHLADVEIGEPGPGQVRVRIDAFGLNRGEVFLRTGRYYYDAVLPGSRLGTEAAGVVEAVGPGVTGYAAGDARLLPCTPAMSSPCGGSGLNASEVGAASPRQAYARESRRVDRGNVLGAEEGVLDQPQCDQPEYQTLLPLAEPPHLIHAPGACTFTGPA